MDNPFVFYTDHQALKYLVNKPLHHGRIFRGLLLFKKFKFEIIVWLGTSSVNPNHLYRIKKGEEPNRINDDLPDTHLFQAEEVSMEFEYIA